MVQGASKLYLATISVWESKLLLGSKLYPQKITQKVLPQNNLNISTHLCVVFAFIS